jgi:hypothetical protein
VACFETLVARDACNEGEGVVVRQGHLIALVVAFVIGCAVVLLVVGCSGTSSETSNKKEQGSSPEATASEEGRCGGTRKIPRKIGLPARFTTNDLPGCPKGGLLLGTDKDDMLYGKDGDDEVRGLGGADDVEGGPGNDIIYGGPGNDWSRGGEGEDVTFVTQKRVAFAAELAISPAPRTPSARSKRALRSGRSAYTSSSARAFAKEEDAWGREQDQTVNRKGNASKG